MTVIPRKLLLLLIISIVCILIILMYNIQLGEEQDISPTAPPALSTGGFRDASSTGDTCPAVSRYPADIETNVIFPTMELEPAWMRNREYWGNGYEDRYVRRRSMWPQLPLRVIVMPHSHTDPGWLKTVEGYYATSTKSIITNIVDKLTQHANMTFIWSEASYLWMWWEEADSKYRNKLRSLLDSGRLEITTGGWVMTDEANVDFFSMVDQLIEGHEFMRSQLGVRPENSWSVDSFGHGGAFPHLLSKAKIYNMVIMRIHYVWKEWLARHQNGNFLWKQLWEKDGTDAPLCHNFPYDIYSIKHSCGPNPQTCLGFDFRHLDGEYNEFTAHYTPLNDANVKARSELLLEQYGRTGSLLPHNVVLVPLGDDFRYSNPLEFDQQYANYIKIMQFINSGDYDAKITFGTLKDFFSEVRSRMDKFPTLSGDFHVYSDIFSEGRPAYWSGYYFTRPYVKLLGRQVASKLRNVEILYTNSLARANKDGYDIPRRVLRSYYPNLVRSRRALALFQHHDAITGTSKAFVMDDYEAKLNTAITELNKIEVGLVEYLMQEDREEFLLNNNLTHTNWRNKGEYKEDEREVVLSSNSRQQIILVNSLPQRVDKIGYFRTRTSNVCVYDSSENLLDVQVAPFHNTTRESKLDFSMFEVWFPVSLEALSLSVFYAEECEWKSKPTNVYCLSCPDSDKLHAIHLKKMQDGAVQLENQIYKLNFHPETRLLRNITNKITGATRAVNLEFSSYTSQLFRSGAYLFDVEDVNGVPSESPMFTPLDISDVVIVSGPVFSEIRVSWMVTGQGGLATFLHTVRLTHDTGSLSEAVHMENLFDFGRSPNFADYELFMRLESDIKNGLDRKLYTDQAGLGMVERTFAEQANVEGNYFPVTESAFIEDPDVRLTLLVDHASGVSSLREGWLEIMVDKRTMHDDARGMGEGVYDSRLTRHRYTLLLEPRNPKLGTSAQTLPFLSPLAIRLSRYLEHPLSTLLRSSSYTSLKGRVGLLSTDLPCDYDLVNLRSWNPVGREADALLILRRLGPDCSWSSLTTADCEGSVSAPLLKFFNLSAILKPTSLTGNHPSPHTSSPLSLFPMEISAYNLTFT